MRFDKQPQEKETTAIATQVTKMKKNLHDFHICIFGLIDLQLESLSVSLILAHTKNIIIHQQRNLECKHSI